MMDRELKKRIKKIFEEKGVDTEDLDLIPKANAKKKLHKFEKITNLKDMINKSGVKFADARNWNIPLPFDGVHFTEEGHRIFAQRLYEYLTREL